MPTPPNAVVSTSPVVKSTSSRQGVPLLSVPDLANASPRPTASSTSSFGSGRVPGLSDWHDSTRPPVCRTKESDAGAISCAKTAMCASADEVPPAAVLDSTASGVNSDAHTSHTASATAVALLECTPTTLTCPPHPDICAGSSTLALERIAKRPVPRTEPEPSPRPAQIVAATSRGHPHCVINERTTSHARSRSGRDPRRVAASTAPIAF